MNFVNYPIATDWDECISEWLFCAKRLTGPLSVFSQMVQSGGLSDNYIPEPYYGDADNCSAVVVNINPGLTDADVIKHWNFRTSPDYRLIYDLSYMCSGKYSDWQAIYAPFTAGPWVPGVQWWADNRNDFIDKVVRLFNCYKGQPYISSKKPFAIELCPFHSGNTGNFKLDSKVLVPYYADFVFGPVEQVIKKSQIPFGIGFASLINTVLKKLGYKKVLLYWKDGYDITNGQPGHAIQSWPINSDDQLWKRTYKLIQSIDETKMTYLLTWDNSGSIIKLTSEMMCKFSAVDDALLKQVAKLI